MMRDQVVSSDSNMLYFNIVRVMGGVQIPHRHGASLFSFTEIPCPTFGKAHYFGEPVGGLLKYCDPVYLGYEP